MKELHFSNLLLQVRFLQSNGLKLHPSLPCLWVSSQLSQRLLQVEPLSGAVRCSSKMAHGAGWQVRTGYSCLLVWIFLYEGLSLTSWYQCSRRRKRRFCVTFDMWWRPHMSVTVQLTLPQSRADCQTQAAVGMLHVLGWQQSFHSSGCLSVSLIAFCKVSISCWGKTICLLIAQRQKASRTDEDPSFLWY